MSGARRTNWPSPRIASYWLGDHPNTLKLNEARLAHPALPAEQRPRIAEKQRLCREALKAVG